MKGARGFPCSLPVPRGWGEGFSPDLHHSGFVLCFTRPQGNLVPLSADVHDSATHFPAVFFKRVPEQTQQLGTKEEGRGSTPPALRPRRSEAHARISSPAPPTLTVSSHRRSSSKWRCCLAMLSSQRPPRLFLLSSHMGWMPSCGKNQINCLPLFKGK